MNRIIMSVVVLAFTVACGDDGTSMRDAGGGVADAGRLEDAGNAPDLCSNTCGPEGLPGDWAGDGECDDGGEGSANAVCALGSDCLDCGSRPGTNTPDSGAADVGPSDSAVPFDSTAPVDSTAPFDGGPPDAGAPDSGPTCDPASTETFQCRRETCQASQVCQVNFAGPTELGARCHDLPPEDRCTPCSTQASNADCSPRDDRLVFDVDGNSIEGCTVSCRI